MVINGMCFIYFGEILCDEFLMEFDIFLVVLVCVLKVFVLIVNDIVCEQCGIFVDMVICLGCYFDMFVQFWMNFQSEYLLVIVYVVNGKQIEYEIELLFVQGQQ